MKRFVVKPNTRGYSLVEMMVVLGIILAITGAFIVTLAGARSKDKVDQVAQLITNDLLQIRSLSLSANVNFRLNFTALTSWRVEKQNGAAWDIYSDTRMMPSDTYLTSASLTNAAANLYATPRGLFSFQGSATGIPYVTITGLGITQTKSLNVYIGGAIEKVTP